MNRLIPKIAIVSMSAFMLLATTCFAEEYVSNDGTIYEYTIRDVGLCIDKITPGNDVTVLKFPEKIDGVPVYRVVPRGMSEELFDDIKAVNIPDGIEDIYLSGFEALESLTLPASITSLRDNCFYDCESLKSVTLPEGLTRIGNSCFENCVSLESIIIPESVTLIGNRAFSGCTSLTVIDWNKNADIGTNVFDETKYISESDEDLLLLNDGTVLYSAMGKNKTIEIPESVTKIYPYAFKDSAVEKVVWSETMKNIEENVFNGASNLKGVEFKGKINKIEDCAFQDCISLTEPIIPEGVTEIPWGCFLNCTGITTAEIPESITKISEGAFEGCKNLKELKFNDGLEQIETSAFKGCESLEELVVPATVESIGAFAFEYCTSLSSLTVKGSATIEKAAFCETNLEEENINLAEGIVYTPVKENKRYQNDPLSFLYDEDSDATEEKVHIPRESKDEDTSADEDEPKTTQIPEVEPEHGKTPVLEVTNQSGEVEVIIENEKVIFPDAKPFIDENDRTQLPIRAVVESIGCEVDYDEETQTVTINSKDIDITLKIGEQALLCNGETIIMDTAARIVDDRTYVPVRYIAESMGYEVVWR